jgi:lysophospholipase L1-like esterase
MEKRRSNGLSRVRGPGIGKILCFFLMLSACCQTDAQRVDFTYKTYGLEVDHDNVIHNAGHLDAFFENLYELRLTNSRKVNIVHIGDSHIQADYMTSIIRRSFHRDFGNAGRGLIVPLRVAGTNEPNNFKTTSNVPWRSKRCVYPEQPLPIGIGGVTIETDNPEASLEIYMNDLWLDYSFNTLTLFFEKDLKSFDFNVTHMQGYKLARLNGFVEDSLPGRSTVSWKDNVNAIRIQASKSNSGQERALIYGAILEKDSNGVLYHTIGVNGAKFRHYNEARYFATQTAALQPDLFIISLGTNESIDYPYLERTILEEVDKLLSALKKNNPDASFILVTPQDVFRKRNKPNPGILKVRDQIIRYAVENGLAFYDLYRAMGGEHSAQSWTDNALLSRDGIHLTKDGYEYQGNLFYHALMKGYNSYVPNRHP